MTFKVSVVIPAYNVERFIEKAVLSVFKLEEVREVVVVNDGSTDGTLEILNDLKNKYPNRLKVLHHLNQANRGRSASRNLGIKKTTSDFIAFLDADDNYLPNRFEKDKYNFENHEVEVVYNAVGYKFYRKLDNDEKNYFNKLNSVTQPLENGNVFESLLSSKYGYLHLNGLTVKKSVFEKVGYFNENLPVAEDSDFIFKLGLLCEFKAGNISEAVAVRGIHDKNIYNDDMLYEKWNIKLYESILGWCYGQGTSKENIDSVLKWLWEIKFRDNKDLFHYIYYWITLSFKFPQTIFSIFFIKYFPVVRLRKKLMPSIFR
ncbi:glycosyltransferase family 2 protein [Tamlana crocina]